MGGTSNIGSYCYIGDNMLTALSVARDCGIIALGQRVVVAHGLLGHSGEPAQLLYTNACNSMPPSLAVVSFLSGAVEPHFSQAKMKIMHVSL